MRDPRPRATTVKSIGPDLPPQTAVSVSFVHDSYATHHETPSFRPVPHRLLLSGEIRKNTKTAC